MGMWGGPPDGPEPRPFAAGNTALQGSAPKVLTNQLPSLIRTDIPELELEAGAVDLAPKTLPDAKGESESSDASSSEGCSVSAAQSASLGWIVVGIVAMWLGRRRVVR
jgi:hypothetical protein